MIRLSTVLPHNPRTWNHTAGNRPKSETLTWISYLASNTVRLAYWQDRGVWGAGFYCVTELEVPESDTRQVYRIEPAVYVSPELWQNATGEYSITEMDKI